MPPAPGDDTRIDAALLRLAAIVTIGAVASILDATIVNICIATLGRVFRASFADVQWVSTSYLLALTAVIPLTGGLMQRFGPKSVWLASIAVFLAGSLLCGFAWSLPSLVAFRVVQGIGGGMILPVAQTVLAQAAGPRRVGRIMGLVSIPGQAVPIFGPAVGGTIIDGLGWRWIFFVNAPLCALALALALRGLPASAGRARAPLDFPGMILLSGGVAAAVYGLSQSTGRAGASAPIVIAPVLAGCAMLAAFVAHSLRVKSAAAIDVRLLRIRSFAATAALMILLGVSIYGPTLLLPLYFQQVRGQSPLAAGLALAPQGAGAMAALVIAGWLTDRIGPGWLVVGGLAVASFGTFGLTRVGSSTSEVLIGVWLVVRGLGLGAAAAPAMAAPYRDLPRDAIPGATSALNIAQRLGGSVGTAAAAIIVQWRLGVDGGHPGVLAGAYRDAFSWSLAVTALAIAPALVLLRRAGQPAAALADSSPEPPVASVEDA